MLYRYIYVLLAVMLLTACKNKNQSSEDDETSIEVFDEAQYLKSKLSDRVKGLIEDFGSIIDSAVYVEELTTIAEIAKSKENASFTSSGIVFNIIQEGSGDKPSKGDKLQIQVTTTGLDEFNYFSTEEIGQALTFTLGTDQIVPALNEVFSNVPEGSEFEIISPSALNYGQKGYTGFVPGNTILKYHIVFEKILESNATIQGETPGLDISTTDDKNQKDILNLTK